MESTTFWTFLPFEQWTIANAKIKILKRNSYSGKTEWEIAYYKHSKVSSVVEYFISDIVSSGVVFRTRLYIDEIYMDLKIEYTIFWNIFLSFFFLCRAQSSIILLLKHYPKWYFELHLMLLACNSQYTTGWCTKQSIKLSPMVDLGYTQLEPLPIAIRSTVSVTDN